MPLTGEASHRFLQQPPNAKAFLFPWSCVHARSRSGKKKCVCIPPPQRIPSWLGRGKRVDAEQG